MTGGQAGPDVHSNGVPEGKHGLSTVRKVTSLKAAT